MFILDGLLVTFLFSPIVAIWTVGVQEDHVGQDGILVERGDGRIACTDGHDEFAAIASRKCSLDFYLALVNCLPVGYNSGFLSPLAVCQEQRRSYMEFVNNNMTGWKYM